MSAVNISSIEMTSMQLTLTAMEETIGFLFLSKPLKSPKLNITNKSLSSTKIYIPNFGLPTNLSILNSKEIFMLSNSKTQLTGVTEF